MLKKKGVLTPYKSPSAADLPAQFIDSESYWAGFAARARVLWPDAARVAYVAADPLSFGLLRMFEVFQEQSAAFQEQEEFATRVFRDQVAARAWLEAWVE